MNIVPAGAFAADVFAAIHAKTFDPAWSASAFHGMLLGMGAFGLIAMAGKEPVGILVGSAAGDNADILTIGVLPAARRQGAGRALLEAALDAAREHGAMAIVLDVAADNGAARALYAALGFEQVGVRKGYYFAGGGAPRDALVLRRSILA